MAFKKSKRLTLPIFSLGHQRNLSVRLTGEIYDCDIPGLAKKEGDLVRVMPCIDLETGEEGLLLVLTVVESSLRRIPGGYVGQCVQLENHGLRQGKGYSQVDVFLLDEVPDGDLFDGEKAT